VIHKDNAVSPMVSAPLALEHALLGFLRDQSMYPYEIYQTLDQAKELGRVWRLKQSQLYALLVRLEEAGYISTTTEARGNRPPRKVMTLTPTGRAAFERWQLTPVAHGREFRLEFLAKLYFASQDGATTVASLIERQRVACQAWLVDLNAQAETLQASNRYDWLVLQFRVNQITAILAWLETCAETLATVAGP
jgi:PadR family transcriptional regulator AphA